LANSQHRWKEFWDETKRPDEKKGESEREKEGNGAEYLLEERGRIEKRDGHWSYTKNRQTKNVQNKGLNLNERVNC
jgi:hypothetical protein